LIQKRTQIKALLALHYRANLGGAKRPVVNLHVVEQAVIRLRIGASVISDVGRGRQSCQAAVSYLLSARFFTCTGLSGS
jgi:hypothetical protein